MARTISSNLTFVYKLLFPVAWIGGFGLGTVMLFLANDSFYAGNASPPGFMKWQFLVFTIAGTAFLRWLCFGLKHVVLNDQILSISNYRREIAVPLSELEDVSENRWINIHPVTLHFRTETAFGRKITFMPTTRLFGFFSSHPIVQELRDAAARSQAHAGSAG